MTASSFPVVSPVTGATLRTYPAMSRDEAHAIVAQVREAFLAWRQTTFAERAQLMRSAADRLIAQQPELAALATEEMGKNPREAAEEIAKCAACCHYFAAHAESLLAPEHPTPEVFRAGGGGENERAYVIFQPLGVILALMPWNYPFWQAVRFLAPGLMAGNACVLKHANNTPGCALALERIFREAGFPQNLFRAVLVDIPEVEHLITHPGIAAVTLTGSVAAGRSVAAIAGQALKKCVLELGGSDPYLVLDDADLDLAAEVCTRGRLMNAGQSCIAAKRMIVVAAVREDFETKFRARMAAWDPPGGMAPLATHRGRDRLHEQVRASIDRGARLLLGGEIPAGPGAYYPPTVLTDVAPGMPAYEDELFGPVASIIPVADEAEAIRVANCTSFGLGAAVFTRDASRGERIAASLEAGGAFVNAGVRSMPGLPFGGIKDSGYGRELGREGIREFVNIKTVLIAGS